ncbi:Hypothetical predicted protein, partial [Olea europaea subsp. europaea]
VVVVASSGDRVGGQWWKSMWNWLWWTIGEVELYVEVDMEMVLMEVAVGSEVVEMQKEVETWVKEVVQIYVEVVTVMVVDNKRIVEIYMEKMVEVKIFAEVEMEVHNEREVEIYVEMV